MSDRHVLVIGGAGVIGSHVVNLLSESEHRVSVLDNTPRHRYFPLLNGKVSIVPIDIRDFASLVDYVRSNGVTHIVHVAAALGRWYDTHPTGSIEVNLLGTANVYEAARLSSVERVVFASSKSVYGSTLRTPHGPPKYMPVEEERVNPSRPYALAKVVGEALGNYYNAADSPRIVCLRFADFYCPERLVKGSTRQAEFVNNLIIGAYAGRTMDLGAGGTAMTDPISVRDVARAVVLATFAPSPSHLVYNVAAGQGITVSDLVSRLQKMFPRFKCRVEPGYDFGDRGEQGLLSSSRIRTDLGFKTEYELESGVEDFISRLEFLVQVNVVNDPRLS